MKDERSSRRAQSVPEPMQRRDAVRVKACQLLIREREIVGAALGRTLCRNPHWDMLLDLYLAEVERRTLYQSTLGLEALGTVSSTHRRTKKLARLGILVIVQDPIDHRRMNVHLADNTLAALNTIMDKVAEAATE